MSRAKYKQDKKQKKKYFYKFILHVLSKIIHDFYFSPDIYGVTITPYLHKIFRKCKVFWQFRTHCKCTFASKISDQLKSRSKNWNTDIWGWFSLTSCPKLVEHIVNIKNVFVEHLGKNWFVECIMSLSGNTTLLTTFTFCKYFTAIF